MNAGGIYKGSVRENKEKHEDLREQLSQQMI